MTFVRKKMSVNYSVSLGSHSKRDKAGDKFSMLCHTAQLHLSKIKLPASTRVKNGSFYNRNHRASQIRCLKNHYHILPWKIEIDNYKVP